MRKPSSGARRAGGAGLQRFIVDRMGRVSTTAAFICGSDINDRRGLPYFRQSAHEEYAGHRGIGMGAAYLAAQRNAHEEAVRKEGYPKYAISDRDDRGRLCAAGKREEYYPILFAEPSPDRDSLLGLDLGAGAAGRAAMRQATATGSATVTVLSDDKTSDTLLFVLEPARYESVAGHMTKRPADQPEADGFVLIVLRMEAMASKWLNLPEFRISPSIDIYISANGKDLVSRTKGSPPLPAHSDAAASTSAPTEPPVGGALVSEEFKVGNANFRVVFVAPARYLADYGTWKPVIASLIGLVITGLVVGYFWLLTGQMASVEHRVAERWLELRERSAIFATWLTIRATPSSSATSKARYSMSTSAPATALATAAGSCCR